jgi:predicted dinucleotide-binding enzyme
MSTVAVLGVGRVGASVARAAVTAGYRVHVAASGPAEDIALLTEVVIPGALAMTTADAVRDADIVVIAVPLSKHRSIDPTPLTGKVVIDAMNYWAPVDGILEDFETRDASSSEIVARHFSRSRVVKTLNHIGYHDFEEHPAPSTAGVDRALLRVVAGESGRRMIIGGCEDNEDLYVGRGS